MQTETRTSEKLSIFLAFIVFYLILTPLAFILRAFGRDKLLLKKSKKRSYWIDKKAVRQTLESFKTSY